MTILLNKPYLVKVAIICKGNWGLFLLYLRSSINLIRVYQCVKSVCFPSWFPFLRSNLLQNSKKFKNQCIFRGRASPSKFMYFRMNSVRSEYLQRKYFCLKIIILNLQMTWTSIYFIIRIQILKLNFIWNFTTKGLRFQKALNS